MRVMFRIFVAAALPLAAAPVFAPSGQRSRLLRKTPCILT